MISRSHEPTSVMIPAVRWLWLFLLSACGTYVRASAGPTATTDALGVEAAAELGTHALVIQELAVSIGLRIQAAHLDGETTIGFAVALADVLYPTPDRRRGGQFGAALGGDSNGDFNLRAALALGVGGGHVEGGRRRSHLLGAEAAWQGDIRFEDDETEFRRSRFTLGLFAQHAWLPDIRIPKMER